MLARIGRMERTVGRTVSWMFNILVLKALLAVCAILGITSYLCSATEPSGWYTPSEYSDATTAHSILWLFIFVFVIGAIAFFFNIIIAVYCLVAWVLILGWIISTIKSAVSPQDGEAGGPKLALHALIGLKVSCTVMCMSKGHRQESYIILYMYIFQFIMALVIGFAYVPFYRFWLGWLSAFRFFPEGILRTITYSLIDTMYYAGVFVLFLL